MQNCKRSRDLNPPIESHDILASIGGFKSHDLLQICIPILAQASNLKNTVAITQSIVILWQHDCMWSISTECGLYRCSTNNEPWTLPLHFFPVITGSIYNEPCLNCVHRALNGTSTIRPTMIRTTLPPRSSKDTSSMYVRSLSVCLFVCTHFPPCLNDSCIVEHSTPSSILITWMADLNMEFFTH